MITIFIIFFVFCQNSNKHFSFKKMEYSGYYLMCQASQGVFVPIASCYQGYNNRSNQKIFSLKSPYRTVATYSIKVHKKANTHHET